MITHKSCRNENLFVVCNPWGSYRNSFQWYCCTLVHSCECCMRIRLCLWIILHQLNVNRSFQHTGGKCFHFESNMYSMLWMIKILSPCENKQTKKCVILGQFLPYTCFSAVIINAPMHQVTYLCFISDTIITEM